MVQFDLGGILRSVRKDVLDGHLDGLENFLMAEYQTFEHDVLVIGAGGAGLRAAIEASAAGVKVGVVSKSLLGSYTLGCHSLRHLIGGIFDQLSKHPARKKAYDCVTCLNQRHMLFAWLSLFWVGFSDLYVRLCAMHIWTDWRLF